MRRIFFVLIFLLLVLTGCEYANAPLPEKVCVKAQNLEWINNVSGIYIANGQVEIELNGCDFNRT